MVNRKVKDRLFRAVFSQDKHALLQLYNALHGTDYQNDQDLEIVTLENIYGTKLIDLPVPQCVVFFNGAGRGPGSDCRHLRICG